MYLRLSDDNSRLNGYKSRGTERGGPGLFPKQSHTSANDVTRTSHKTMTRMDETSGNIICRIKKKLSADGLLERLIVATGVANVAAGCYKWVQILSTPCFGGGTGCLGGYCRH